MHVLLTLAADGRIIRQAHKHAASMCFRLRSLAVLTGPNCAAHAHAPPCAQEGFQPATFRSSRSDRAGRKEQSVDDFLDEDERAERDKAVLAVKVSIPLAAGSVV